MTPMDPSIFLIMYRTLKSKDKYNQPLTAEEKQLIKKYKQEKRQKHKAERLAKKNNKTR